ncbi:MAG TPA: GntR family transcriptional regulator [Burkholderiaceae bacterium]
MQSAYALQEAIAENIRAGKWKPGDRLPTERALAEQFRISRNTVRQALIRFKREGVLMQKVGSGTYVRVPDALGPADNPVMQRSISPAELMAARLAFEPAIVEMIVMQATNEDFQRMENCLRCANAAGSLEEYEHWGSMLHEVIAEAAHNPVVSRVFELLKEVRAQGQWGMLKRRGMTPEGRPDDEREHAELVAALKDRDFARARAITVTHLLNTRKALMGQ